MTSYTSDNRAVRGSSPLTSSAELPHGSVADQVARIGDESREGKRMSKIDIDEMKTSIAAGGGSAVPSTANPLKTSFAYLVAVLFCAFFGAVYELFSHGVYSYFMMYAFAIPLALGVLPNLAATRFGWRAPNKLAANAWNSGVAALTVGCIFQGALEIYGTTNQLAAVYPVVAAALLAVGVVFHVRDRLSCEEGCADEGAVSVKNAAAKRLNGKGANAEGAAVKLPNIEGAAAKGADAKGVAVKGAAVKGTAVKRPNVKGASGEDSDATSPRFALFRLRAFSLEKAEQVQAPEAHEAPKAPACAAVPCSVSSASNTGYWSKVGDAL